jgi:cytochrome c-type biogenesis protein CcmE
MRILLRNEDTGLFYVHPNGWTENPSSGHDFRSGGLATQIALKLKLKHSTVVFEFPDATLNFSIPLSLATHTQSCDVHPAMT